jgi:PiT family inorganic phosphate transporter
VAFGGFGELQARGLITIGVALIVSPLVGFAIAWLLLRLVMFAARKATPGINRLFNHMQIGTALVLSLSHGSNDAQKTMGVITLALVTLGYQQDFAVPLWVVLVSAAAISVGTASGGWRIIKTLGGRFYKIRPVHALTSQAASAAVIVGASLAGGPVSTTHVVSSSIVGAGASQRAKMVRWANLTDIGVAWVITVPAAALAGAAAYLVLRPLVGT